MFKTSDLLVICPEAGELSIRARNLLARKCSQFRDPYAMDVLAFVRKSPKPGSVHDWSGVGVTTYRELRQWADANKPKGVDDDRHGRGKAE